MSNPKISFSVQSSSKTSFKLNSKSPQNFSADGKDEDQSKKEFVTEFDPSKTLENTNSKRRVIVPRKVDEFHPRKRMRNLDTAIAQSNNGSDQLHFELEKKSAVDDDSSKISYGLNLRDKIASSNGNVGIHTVDSRAFEPAEKGVLKDFKHDLERLPDDEGFKEFDDMPVEDFGAALLSGLGWVEGRGIGRNAKEDVKIKQFEKKSFVSDDDRPQSIASKSSHKNLMENDGFSVGRDVRVTEGKHMGLKGRIVERIGGDWVVLSFEKSEKEVKLRISDICHFGSKDEEKCLKRLQESRIRQMEDKDREAKFPESQKRVDKRIRESERTGKGNKKEKFSWLRSHIRVKIICKDFKRGRLYLKKGEVVDVVGPTTCDISMDETGELIQGVDQDVLETVLPRTGGPVLVLYGRHKGIYGNLVQKDKDSETGVVRDADSHELLNVKYQQIAEYIGDPSYIGY